MTTLDQLEYSERQLKRLREWMENPNRQPAQTFFTAGELRNAAREFEFQLYKLNPTTVPYQCCPVCNGTGQTVAGGTCEVCKGDRIIPMYILPEVLIKKP